MEQLSAIATLIIASGAVSLLCLLILHFVSPEFKPNWRMVSEYALGKHEWLLTLFFITWGVSTIAAAYLYFKLAPTNWAILGSVLVLISGVGAIAGGLFNMKHKLHGLSFALGVPTFPIGALIIAYQLGSQNSWLQHKNELLTLAYCVCGSLVLMGLSMGLLFSGLKKAGVPFGPNEAPLTAIPKGVVGINGYANRLLVLAYVAFNVIVAIMFKNF